MSQVSLAQAMISSLLNESRHNAISPGQLAGIYQVLLDLFSLDEKARNQAIADMTRLRDQAAKSVSDAQSVLEGLNFLPFDSIVQTRQLAKTTLTAGQIYYCTDEQKFLVLYDKGGGELDSRQPDGYNRNMKGRDDALFLCLEDRLLYQISLSDNTTPIATIHLYNSTADAGKAPFEIHRFDLYNPTVADRNQAAVGTIAFTDLPGKRYFEIKTADGWQPHADWNFTADRKDYPKPGLYAWTDILFWCRETGRYSQMHQLTTSEDTTPHISIYLGEGVNIKQNRATHVNIYDNFGDLKDILGRILYRPKTSSCIAAVSIEMDDPTGQSATTLTIATVPVAFKTEEDIFLDGEAYFNYDDKIWHLKISMDRAADTAELEIFRVSEKTSETFENIRNAGRPFPMIFESSIFDSAFGEFFNLFSSEDEYNLAKTLPQGTIVWNHMIARFGFVGPDGNPQLGLREAKEAGISIDKGAYRNLGMEDNFGHVYPTLGRIYASSRTGKLYIACPDTNQQHAEQTGGFPILREINISNLFVADNK